jgi:hypothetical protein
VDAAAADTAAVDTAAAPVARPSQLLIVELAEGVELIPEAEYQVTARGLRNIVGLVGDAEGEFTAPELPPEPAAPDTAGAPADTVAQRSGEVDSDPSLAVGYRSGTMRQVSQMRTGRLFYREGAKTPGDKAPRFLRETPASWGHEHVVGYGLSYPAIGYRSEPHILLSKAPPRLSGFSHA